MQNRKWLATERIYGGSQLEKKECEKETGVKRLVKWRVSQKDREQHLAREAWLPFSGSVRFLKMF